ncbi:MAG: class I SAM-dependent rRNA methyltransferase [Spirochaetes bacterium]|nr:class I SAM-dependent rRNA methyltransferase [Spirochaetota bacterium]
MLIVCLKPREEIRIRRGHPWVYDNEIASVSGRIEPGSAAKVVDSRGKLLGYGFFNPTSKIRVRIFSKSKPEADEAFFEEAFRSALAFRTRFFDPAKQSLRLVFGEADSIPGLVVDRFVGKAETGSGAWLSTQFLSLGVEVRKAEIVEALGRVFSPDGIIERSDAPVRALEGLEPALGTLAGTVPSSILMEESGAFFSVDLSAGQKTGWFLDQRANRAAAARYAPGARVLDAFCNQGGFGILCGKAGAKSVIAVDSSADALTAARRNADINGLNPILSTVEANTFDYLRSLERAEAAFDMVILDPPAFAKSRAAVEPAHRGYREINLRAMHLIPKGGILVTCSCSHWFDDERFDAVLAEAASDCGRRFRTIEERTQDLDHPIVSGYDESRYLKCRILEML